MTAGQRDQHQYRRCNQTGPQVDFGTRESSPQAARAENIAGVENAREHTQAIADQVFGPDIEALPGHQHPADQGNRHAKPEMSGDAGAEQQPAADDDINGLCVDKQHRVGRRRTLDRGV